MAIYFFDKDQKIVKIVPDSSTLEAYQTQELTDDSLMKDVLDVTVKGDEKLLDAEYMAVKSYRGNKQAFDMYRIVTDVTPDRTMSFTGMGLAPYELDGVIIQDMRPANHTVTYTLNRILEDTDWNLGHVDDGLRHITTTFYYVSVKEALKTMQALIGCEFVFKVEISGNKITDKWVEAYHQLGDRTRKRFNYGTNALTVVRETNKADIYTALIGRGKGEEVSSAEDNPGGQAGYGRKLTFDEVEWSLDNGDPLNKPKGQYYLELPQATLEYGVRNVDGSLTPRIGIVEFQEEEDVNRLIQLTYEQLKVSARPKVLFKSTVANIGSTGIGDTVTIHRHDLGIHYEARVRKVVRNKLNDNKTEVQLGDEVVTPSTRQAKQNVATIKNLTQELERVKTDVTETRLSADGRTNNHYGPVEPKRKRTGDTWFRPHPSLAGETQTLTWTGEVWELVLDTSEMSQFSEEIEKAKEEITKAQESADKAVHEIDVAVASAGFTSLGDTLTGIQSISQRAQSNAQSALSNAQTAQSLASELSGKVSGYEQTVNGFTQTVNNYEDQVAQFSSDVTGLNSTIASYETEVDEYGRAVNTYATQVTTFETTVKGLQSTVSNPETGLMSQVTQLANGFRVLSTDFENFEVGGRNLILNSNNFRIHTGYNGATVIIEDNIHIEEWGASDATKLTVSGGTNDIKTTPRIESGLVSEEFTYSYWVKNVGSVPVDFYYNGFNGDYRHTIDVGESKRVVLTGRTRTNYTWFQHQIRPHKGYEDEIIEVVLWRMQLEKGNVATDWSPAPEDMATQSQLTVLSDNINLRVKKDDLLSQINIEAGRTLIQSDKLLLNATSTVITGTSWMDGAVIKNLSVDGAKIMNASIASAKIVSLDVHKISGLTSEFVQSYWNSATGGSVKATGDGIQSTSSDGSQVYIQNGVVGARNPSGGGLGHFGYNSDTNRTFLNISASLGTNFSISAYLPDGNSSIRRTMLDIFPGSSETYIRTNEFRHTGATGVAGEILARFSGNVTIDGNINALTSNMTIQQINFRYGSWIYDDYRNSNLQVIGGNRLRLYTSGSSGSSSEALMFDGTYGYMYRNLSMENNKITNQSDRRLKQDIQATALNSLEAIMSWRVVDFDWKDEATRFRVGRQMGLIAQDTPEIAIYEADRDIWSIDSSRQIMMNTHAIHQLGWKHEQLASKSESNEQKMHDLQKELSQAARRIQELEEKID